MFLPLVRFVWQARWHMLAGLLIVAALSAVAFAIGPSTCPYNAQGACVDEHGKAITSGLPKR